MSENENGERFRPRRIENPEEELRRLAEQQRQRPRRIENPQEELRRMAEEQGVTETATFEYMSGAGVGLWVSDEEFDEWIRLLAQIRSEK